MDLDANAQRHLERQLRAGNVVLVTGAGFSADAVDKDGRSLPVGSDLRDELWPIAFPDLEVDHSTLGEVFDAAVAANRGATERLLKKRLTVDRDRLPDYYGSFLSIPWYRIYTLNFDNLWQAAQVTFDSPHDVRIVSALSERIPEPQSMSVVHLNGTLSDFPDVTFSPPQYGARTANRDMAYDSLVRDLLTRPVVFVGTVLDEAPLWQHLAMRGDKPGRGTREMRPRSYLVTPGLPAAKRVMLSSYNIVHLSGYASDFAETFLSPIAADPPARPPERTRTAAIWLRVADAAAEPAPPPAEFLMGREPMFGDVSDGYAIERTVDRNLVDAVLAGGSTLDVRFIIGTAGSGKSTTARRLALAASAAGERSLWLSTGTSASLGTIRGTGIAAEEGLLFIDQLERFGTAGVDLVRALAETVGKQVIACLPSTSFEYLGYEKGLSDLKLAVHTVPHLTDEDIDGLLDALRDASRLGRMTSWSRDQQREALRESAGRQLLVAMIEATTGERFEDKIVRECGELQGDLELTYAVLCLATKHRVPLRRDELLAVADDYTPEGLEALDRLIRGGLAVATGEYGHVARHPLIADRALEHFGASGKLGAPLSQLAFVMATRVAGDSRGREGRLLRRLISHSDVESYLGSVRQVREMYESLEPLLSDDFHYWLQRGNYDLDRGDRRMAQNFLSTAQSLRPGHYMVDTAWGHLKTQLAIDTPDGISAREHFEEGFGTLLDVIETRGERTPNTYVLLAQQSARWVATGVPTRHESQTVLEVVRRTMRAGSARHGGNRYFVAAKEEVDRTYLGLAVSE